MTEMLRLFRQENPLVTLTVGEDCICKSCPHNLSHICDAAEKVSRYDNAVLTLCELSEGNTLPWSEFCARVDQCILDCGKLEQICGDCAWYTICGHASAASQPVAQR